LILRYVDVLASVLRGGELIEADSLLKPLGRQVAGIDVPGAEVGPIELLEKLAAITSRPEINLVLYHGVLACMLGGASRWSTPSEWRPRISTNGPAPS